MPNQNEVKPVVQPPMPPAVQRIIETGLSFVPSKYKRIVGGLGVVATLVAHHLGYISGEQAFYIGGAFGGVAFAGLLHADIKTDNNVAALESQLQALKAEIQRMTGK